MPRNMSFAMTTRQIEERSKTVTRRFGWSFLKPGDVVCAVEKAMGLRKGEKIRRLGYIRIKTVRREPLNAISQEDVIREGFPTWKPADFIEMICRHYKCRPDVGINRIEFDYVLPDLGPVHPERVEWKGDKRRITQ